MILAAVGLVIRFNDERYWHMGAAILALQHIFWTSGGRGLYFIDFVTSEQPFK